MMLAASCLCLELLPRVVCHRPLQVYLASWKETAVAVKILMTVDDKQLEDENAAGLLSLSSPILRVLQKVGFFHCLVCRGRMCMPPCSGSSPASGAVVQCHRALHAVVNKAALL